VTRRITISLPDDVAAFGWPISHRLPRTRRPWRRLRPPDWRSSASVRPGT